MKINRSIIGFIFTLIALVVGIFGYQDAFITSLSHVTSLPKTQQQNRILPSSPYRGQFTAANDRLGIVRILVSTEGRINTNTLVFRLRELGSETWLVENTYVTDRFIDGEKYPFGFPIISNSKGKIYEYEFSTNDGSEENTILIVPGNYSLLTEYIYSKSLILTDKQTTFWFLKEKGKEMFSSIPHAGYWMMCLLPVFLLTNIYIFASIFMIGLFAFLPMQIHSNMILWIGLSVLGVTLYKKNYQLPFVLSLITLVVCTAAYFFHAYGIASKLGTIIPILLVIGVVAVFRSLKH